MVIAARNSRSSRFQALKIKQNSSNNQDEIRDNKQLEINNKEVLELLTKRLKKFLDKSTLLLFSHLFEMSIQKQEGYRIFG
jgi:adenylate cyclase 10